MLMHLSSGHATSLPEKFQPPKFPPNQTYGGLTLGFAQILSISYALHPMVMCL